MGLKIGELEFNGSSRWVTEIGGGTLGGWGARERAGNGSVCGNSGELGLEGRFRTQRVVVVVSSLSGWELVIALGVWGVCWYQGSDWESN